MTSENTRPLTAVEAAPHRLRRIRSRLLRWGRANFQEYPWRHEHNPWLTLVAELLLQRTRAAQVEPVFNELRERFPTPASVVSAGEAAARGVTGPLGLHFRGPQLFGLATSVNDQGGVPPSSDEALRSIAGVGPYTAAAWLSLHQGKRAVIVDSNIVRWLSRITGRPYNRDPRGIRWVNELADLLTPSRAFRDYNYAVLDFTMLICTPARPRCPTCPLRRDCKFGRAARASVSR